MTAAAVVRRKLRPVLGVGEEGDRVLAAAFERGDAADDHGAVPVERRAGACGELGERDA